jgi:hypothetical protein
MVLEVMVQMETLLQLVQMEQPTEETAVEVEDLDQVEQEMAVQEEQVLSFSNINFSYNSSIKCPIETLITVSLFSVYKIKIMHVIYI